jgi:hypothetical protein
MFSNVLAEMTSTKIQVLCQITASISAALAEFHIDCATILLQTVDLNLLNNFRRNLLSVLTCAVQMMCESVYDGKTKS